MRKPQTARSWRATPARGLFALTLFAVAAGGLSGCYERVVNARGLGADQYSVSESYQESGGEIDNWLFGTPTPTTRQRQGSLLNRR